MGTKTSRQWEIDWEVACANNIPMTEFIISQDRQIEAILNAVVVVGEGSEQVRQKLSDSLYNMVNDMGVNSYIVGNGVGFQEAAQEAVNRFKKHNDTINLVWQRGLFLSSLTFGVGVVLGMWI
jgi:hypothetical protein